jgi:hypothetical protein
MTREQEEENANEPSQVNSPKIAAAMSAVEKGKVAAKGEGEA